MAITAYFGLTGKRVNSTAIPTLTDNYSVVLKQPCSLETPVIVLKASSCDYNYMSMLGKYYWITDVISLHDQLWEIHAQPDALANLRAEILATPAFVDYASIGFDKDLADTRLEIPNKPVTSVSYATFFRTPSPYYILTAAGANGTISTYALTSAQFSALLTAINAYQLTQMPDIVSAGSVIDAIRDFGNQLAKAFRQLFSFGSALDAITSCYWIPYEPVMSDVSYRIYLGDYDTGVDAPIMQRNMPLVTETTATFTLYNDWRDYAPYSRFSLFVPFVGTVQLPNENVIAAGGNINCRCSYTAENGDMAIILREGSAGRVISSYSCTIAAAIKIARNALNVEHIAGSAVRVLTGDYAALPALARSCLDATIDSAGSLGTLAAIGQPMQLIAQKAEHLPAGYNATSTAIQGLPVSNSALLSVHEGGFVQTRDVHINGSNLEKSETQTAEAMLNGGVYLE